MTQREEGATDGGQAGGGGEEGVADVILAVLELGVAILHELRHFVQEDARAPDEVEVHDGLAADGVDEPPVDLRREGMNHCEGGV